jgi:hypothetical protein
MYQINSKVEMEEETAEEIEKKIDKICNNS